MNRQYRTVIVMVIAVATAALASLRRVLGYSADARAAGRGRHGERRGRRRAAASSAHRFAGNS